MNTILNYTHPNNITGIPGPPVSGGKTDVWYWRIALFGAGGAAVECVGTVCNIIAIIVLAHFRHKSSAPFLLICLAVMDTIYLLSYLVLENLTLMSMGGIISKDYRDFIKPFYSIFYPLPFVAQTCVAYLVVIITLERYTVVVWPFVAHRLCNMKSALIAVLIVVGYSILYHIPTYLAYTYTCCDPKKQGRVKKFIRTDFGNSEFYNEIFSKWMNLTFNFGIPFIILLTFNTLTVLALRKEKGVAATAQNRRGNEQRLTIMVFCMTVIFFLCELLAALSLLILSGLSSYMQPTTDMNRFSAVADLFMLINSAINFAIYCASGRKFRETFSQLFCRWCGKPYRKSSDKTTSRPRPRKDRSSKFFWARLFKSHKTGCHAITMPPESSVSSVASNSTKLSAVHSTSADDNFIKLTIKQSNSGSG